MARHHKRRVPTLKFTKLRQIGRHVSYRDKQTGVPHRHRFNIPEGEREAEARVLYHAWVLEHLGGKMPEQYPTKAALPARTKSIPEWPCVSEGVSNNGGDFSFEPLKCFRVPIGRSHERALLP